MFDIGFLELIIVAIVALLVLGPERLPGAIRTTGLWVGRIRRTLSSIQEEINQELQLEELKRTIAISEEELKKELDEVRQPFIEAAKQTEEDRAIINSDKNHPA